MPFKQAEMTDPGTKVDPSRVAIAPEVKREADRPTVDGGKLLVFIVTPVREFPSPEAWEELTPEEKAAHMPAAVRKALYDLAKRGGPGWVSSACDSTEEANQQGESDRFFREQANKYTFEWGAAVGGLCRARNGAVHEFMEAKGHFLIWWDNDLEPDGMTPAEAILRLLSHRVGIVGGFYCKRAKKPVWAASFMPAAEMQKEPTRENLLQLAELAGGFTCIFWRVYSEIGRLMFKIKYRDRDTGKAMMAFYQNVNVDGDFLSEDYWLCFLARCSVIAIWGDVKLRLRHFETAKDGTKRVYPEGDFPPIQAVDNREGEE